MSDAALAEDWRTLVDPATLQRWMDERGLGSGPIGNVAPLTGGTQNILLRFDRDNEAYVLRRPPLHKRPESDEVMRREMRVLAALAGTAVPHPDLVAGESNTSPLGAAFYLMRPVDGFNPSMGLPDPHASRPDWRERMGAALVDALIALAKIDPAAKGLGDLSRSEGWLDRQVSRWRRQLDGYAAQQGWTGLDALPPIDPICAWLEAHRPHSSRAGLLHGDYHLANVLFRPDAPELAAIVDWELASIGDPLLDLGWLTATWPDDGFEAIIPVMPWDGFPPAAELVDRYCAATGRSEADARWFGILACFKLAVLLEGTHARACAGLAPKTTGNRLHAQAIALLDRALHRIQ